MRIPIHMKYTMFMHAYAMFVHSTWQLQRGIMRNLAVQEWSAGSAIITVYVISSFPLGYVGGSKASSAQIPMYMYYGFTRIALQRWIAIIIDQRCVDCDVRLFLRRWPRWCEPIRTVCIVYNMHTQ